MSRLISIVAIATVLITGCATGGSSVRSWIDEQTAVTVTAQKKAMVFYREDFQAGVNIYDYANLGAFDINRAGAHRRYLCLALWSTLARTEEQQAKLETAFANLVIWADDQPLTFKRVTQNREMLNVVQPVFKLPSSEVQENYYEVSTGQLSILALAHELRVASSEQAQGEAMYHPWRNERNSLNALVENVTGIDNKINR